LKAPESAAWMQLAATAAATIKSHGRREWITM
jgi:hypothetical protein